MLIGGPSNVYWWPVWCLLVARLMFIGGLSDLNLTYIECTFIVTDEVIIISDTAYCQNKDTRQWYHFDDSSVTKISEDAVIVSKCDKTKQVACSGICMEI